MLALLHGLPTQAAAAADANAAATETLAVPLAAGGAAASGALGAVLQAGAAEKAIMLCLALFSILSWGIIGQKVRQLRLAARESETFLETFWGTKRLDAIFSSAEGLVGSPVAQVFVAGYVELGKIRKQRGEPSSPGADEGSLLSVGRAMQRTQVQQLAQLEELLPFLATVGSTAPFIGLLGTVVGIMGAFSDIGVMGNANLATVAPGIGGALVATAFGLFAAIPAVMAYNFFLARLRALDLEMQMFGADFLNIVRRHFF